jgi:transposase
MPRPKPPYPAEFRQQIVELVGVGKTPAQLAREFDCSAQTIANWVAQAAADRGQPLPGKSALTSAERDELMRLRRECRQLKMERDILAKATAWFAGKGDKTVIGSSSS